MKARTTTLGIMGWVAFVAIGTAALRSGDGLWAAAVFSLTVAALCTTTLVSVYRRGAWAGFAVFGWASFLICQPHSSPPDGPPSLQMGLVYQLLALSRTQSILPPASSETPAFATTAHDVDGQPLLAFTSSGSLQPLGHLRVATLRVAYCLLSLIFGSVGAVVGGLIDRRSLARRDR